MQVLGEAGPGDGVAFSVLTDIATGSVLLFTNSGAEWSRTIRAPRVNALFDQIVASLRGCGPVCTSPPQTLLAFSDGAPDSLLLEWGTDRQWPHLEEGMEYPRGPDRVAIPATAVAIPATAVVIPAAAVLAQSGRVE